MILKLKLDIYFSCSNLQVKKLVPCFKKTVDACD